MSYAGHVRAAEIERIVNILETQLYAALEARDRRIEELEAKIEDLENELSETKIQALGEDG